MKKIFTFFTVLFIALTLSAETIDVVCTTATVSSENLSSGDTKVTFSGTADVNGQTKPINIMVWNGNIVTTATYASPDVYGAIGTIDVEGSGTIDVQQTSITLTATLAGGDGNTYNVTMTHSSVQTITLTNMTITPGEEGAGYTYQFLSMGEAPFMGIMISLATATDFNGTFTVTDLSADHSAIVFTNGNMASFVSGTIIVTTTANVTKLQADVVASDGVTYDITMTAPPVYPEPDYTITSTNLRVLQDENEVNLVLSGLCELGNIALYLFDGVAKGYGEYGMVDDGEGEVIATIFGLIKNVNVEGTGTYSYSEELQSDLLKATLTGTDGKIYDLTMYNAAKDTIEVICSNLTTEDYTNRWNQRFLILTGTSSVGKVEINIFGYTGEYGEYGWLDAENAAISGEINGVWAQGAGTWSYSEELKSDLLDALLEDESGETIYRLMMYKSAPTALENITIDGTASKYISNGQLFILKNGVQYNAQGAVVK